MKTNRPPFFAEVIEGTLTHFTALCWEWNQTEAFGSIIATESEETTVFAVVASIQEGSSDPTRTPHAYQKTEAELRRDHPHIFEFLQTTLSGKIIGFCTAQKKFVSQIPPKPPLLHAFVRPATEAEKEQIKQSSHFLHLLCSDLNPAIADELMLGFMYQETKNRTCSPQELELYANACANVLQGDYQRLRLLFQRMESFTTL
ncbi:MAG: hypothetical protein UV38_C0001G0062 [candidate division TM6 bacterium GW2011_GWE2_42_60]|nr:MAG: hypothetical protein UV38_C0001G0062 [candidate division TM6 bacterium GW2011_GWE2_42_60]HBY05743.1 hypothetical protein [Candidatus Dependentiae bacterium]